jgi:hypothetical protein
LEIVVEAKLTGKLMVVVVPSVIYIEAIPQLPAVDPPSRLAAVIVADPVPSRKIVGF